VIEKSRAEYVLILSADQVYRMDYGELLYHHATSRADVTVAVQYPVELAGSPGVIETDPSDRVIGFKENPVSSPLVQSNPEKAHVNMGVYVFSREPLIETLRKNVALNCTDDFGRDILFDLIRSGRAGVFQFGGYWRQIDTLDSYYQTNLDLLLTGAAWDPYENGAWPTRTLAGPQCLQRSWLASQSRVSLDATLTACEVWMSIVSKGVRIDADAELEAAIVLPGAHIGSGAKIRNAIVAEQAVVSPHALIGYDTEGDWPQFPVTEKGVVIVGAPEPNRQRVPLQSSHLPVTADRSIALVRPRAIQTKMKKQ